MVAATGYMRMYNNKHWFSDVVAGAGIGIVSTKIAYWIYSALQNYFRKKNCLLQILNLAIKIIIQSSLQMPYFSIGHYFLRSFIKSYFSTGMHCRIGHNSCY